MLRTDRRGELNARPRGMRYEPRHSTLWASPTVRHQWLVTMDYLRICRLELSVHLQEFSVRLCEGDGGIDGMLKKRPAVSEKNT